MTRSTWETEQKKVIYLTFDAGYENGYTASDSGRSDRRTTRPRAFSSSGIISRPRPDLVRRMVNEGHIVGNHTYHHYDMSKISDAASFRKELSERGDALSSRRRARSCKNITARRRAFTARKISKWQRSSATGRYSGSLAYVDWYQDDQPTEEQAFSKLLPRIHPGAVVLLHSTSQYERGNSRCAADKMGGHGLPVREPRRAVRVPPGNGTNCGALHNME